jgi:2-polyprenyl-6-hydroxyphenyl methylase/3-demethylubiquinone-9 3-methyltransferase
MSTTINKEEIQKFSKLADEWWDVKVNLNLSICLTPIRIEYIIDSIKKNYNIKNGKPDLLKRLNILDIGCGGGLISEPMARLGANVTGIDASAKIFMWPDCIQKKII